MKKILNILEKNVQWVALGLGILFFAYIVWTDLYNNPASKSVTLRQGAAVVTPSTVDSQIADDIEHNLQPKIHAQHADFRVDVKFPAPISLDTPATTQPAPAATAVAWNSWGFDISDKIQAISKEPAQSLIQSLPTIPALRYVDQEFLRTVLTTSTGNKDADAVTTFWAFPAAQVAKEYKAAFGSKIPETAQTIEFVQVVVTRQEQLDNGDWGNEIVVERPANFPAPPFPYPQPAGTDQKAHLEQYRQWMSTNQQPITEPDFPPVAFQRADLQWQKLADWIPARAQQEYLDSLPVVVAPPVVAQAANPPAKVVARGNQAQSNQGISEVFPPPDGTTGGGAFDVTPALRTAIDRGGSASPPPAASVPGAPVNPNAPPPPPVPQLAVFPAGGLPLSAIAGPQEFAVWCHDLTVQPGKKYRYKVRYTLLNPVYGQPNRATPEIADTFGIDSPNTAWSETAVVPSRTHFFAAGNIVPAPQSDDQKIPFTVFTWHNGMWQKKEYVVAPGDEIGADEGDGGDFLTHYTLLNASSSTHNDSTSYSVLVAPDNGGPAQDRDFHTDSTSQDLKRLQQKFDAQVAPVAPAAP
jgi:hypothetical protein